MGDVILGGESRPEERKSPKRTAEEVLRSVASVFLAFGLVLVGVGIVDLAMAWFPFRLGVDEWEFGTASRTFDSLALGTTGFVFVVVAATLKQWSLAQRILGGVAAVVLVLLLMVYALYGMNIPIALAAVSAETETAMTRAIARTTVFALLYLVLFGWITWFAWRRGGAEKGA